MFTVHGLLNLIGVMLSLTPFVGVGYYFGRLDKRVSAIETKNENVDERLNYVELNLGIKT